MRYIYPTTLSEPGLQFLRGMVACRQERAAVFYAWLSTGLEAEHRRRLSLTTDAPLEAEPLPRLPVDLPTADAVRAAVEITSLQRCLVRDESAAALLDNLGLLWLVAAERHAERDHAERGELLDTIREHDLNGAPCADWLTPDELLEKLQNGELR